MRRSLSSGNTLRPMFVAASWRTATAHSEFQNMRVNGKAVGEIETRAALAGAFGTPVIFLSGDTAAAEELRAIVPAAETVSVKEGLGRYTCISKSADAARAVTREHARLAMAKLGTIRPYLIEGPATIEIEYTTRNSLPPGAASRPGAEVVDDRTIRYRGQNFSKPGHATRSTDLN